MAGSFRKSPPYSATQAMIFSHRCSRKKNPCAVRRPFGDLYPTLFKTIQVLFPTLLHRSGRTPLPLNVRALSNLTRPPLLDHCVTQASPLFFRQDSTWFAGLSTPAAAPRPTVCDWNPTENSALVLRLIKQPCICTRMRQSVQMSSLKKPAEGSLRLWLRYTGVVFLLHDGPLCEGTNDRAEVWSAGTSLNADEVICEICLSRITIGRRQEISTRPMPGRQNRLTLTKPIVRGPELWNTRQKRETLAISPLSPDGKPAARTLLAVLTGPPT